MATPPVVTAVGRRLKPKHGEPHRHQVIAVKADGTGRIVLDRPVKSES